MAGLEHGVRIERGHENYNVNFRVKPNSRPDSQIDLIFDPYLFNLGGPESHVYVNFAVIGSSLGGSLDYVTLERTDEGLVIVHISPAAKLADFNAYLKHRLEGERIWEDPRRCAEVLVSSIDDSIPVLAEYVPELKILGETVGKSEASDMRTVAKTQANQVS